MSRAQASARVDVPTTPLLFFLQCGPRSPQATHSSPPVAVGSRRGETPEKLAHVFRPLGPRASRHSRETGIHVRLLGPCFATATNEKSRKTLFFVCHCLGSLGLVVRTWKHKREQNTRHVRQQRETLRCGPAPYTRRSDAPLQVGQRRCGSRSWRPVDQLKFVGIDMRWSAGFVIV